MRSVLLLCLIIKVNAKGSVLLEVHLIIFPLSQIKDILMFYFLWGVCSDGLALFAFVEA